MNRRHVFGVALATVMSVCSTPAGARSTTTSAGALPPLPLCGSASARSIEYHYTVRARVRPLMFWTARRDVGEAWFVLRDAEDRGQRVEMLVGTDPARTPMRLNRWGYLAETMCGDRADLLGVMTESDEQTIEQAQAVSTNDTRLQAMKAIRARYGSGRATTEIVTMAQPAALTYRDLQKILALLPATATAIGSDIPSGSESGFLAAVRSLIHDSVLAHGDSGRERSGLRRTYVYGDRVYDATLETSTTVTRKGVPAVIESEFQVRNRNSGSITEFSVAYPVSGEGAEVPIRIAYRPRWWLELELVRESSR